jgi:hypothetical protein
LGPTPIPNLRFHFAILYCRVIFSPHSLTPPCSRATRKFFIFDAGDLFRISLDSKLKETGLDKVITNRGGRRLFSASVPPYEDTNIYLVHFSYKYLLCGKTSLLLYRAALASKKQINHAEKLNDWLMRLKAVP